MRQKYDANDHRASDFVPAEHSSLVICVKLCGQ
jgi:hypothetical protein